MGSIKVSRENAPVDSVPYGESVIPAERQKYLDWLCRKTLRQWSGNVLEVGVYRGGTFRLLAQAVKDICPKFSAYGIDTFEGHPYSDGHEVHPMGKYGDVDPVTLRSVLIDLGLAPEWSVLLQGKVEDMLLSLDLSEFTFAHVDCDLYIPVLFCAKYLRPRMASHGVIFFDDFGHKHCPGATKAVLEVYGVHEIHEVYLPHDDTCWSCYVQW